MHPVSPVIPNENFKELMIAENQDEYQTLPALNCGNGVIFSRWEFDAIELEKLEAEKTLYIYMLTFGNKPRAMILLVETPQFPMTFSEEDKPLEAVPFTTEYNLAKFPVTEEQFSIIKESRSIYAFMQTENQPVMPYLIEVDAPVYPEPTSVVLARFEDYLMEIGSKVELNPSVYLCDKCSEKVIGTEVVKQLLFNKPFINIYCSTCFRGMDQPGMYLPETIEEYNKIKEFIK